MKKNVFWALALASGITVGLAGCTGSAGYSAGAAASSPSATASPAAAPAAGGYGAGGGSRVAGATALTTAKTPLGTIVVNGSRMTVYVFDKDSPNSGKSACARSCLPAWPPVLAGGASVAATGVTGKLGTIAAASGAKQVTLNGLPLYTYAGDREAGDFAGQGVGGVWWAVSPSGAKITGK